MITVRASLKRWNEIMCKNANFQMYNEMNLRYKALMHTETDLRNQLNQYQQVLIDMYLSWTVKLL